MMWCCKHTNKKKRNRDKGWSNGCRCMYVVTSIGLYNHPKGDNCGNKWVNDDRWLAWNNKSLMKWRLLGVPGAGLDFLLAAWRNFRNLWREISYGARADAKLANDNDAGRELLSFLHTHKTAKLIREARFHYSSLLTHQHITRSASDLYRESVVDRGK